MLHLYSESEISKNESEYVRLARSLRSHRSGLASQVAAAIRSVIT